MLPGIGMGKAWAAAGCSKLRVRLRVRLQTRGGGRASDSYTLRERAVRFPKWFGWAVIHVPHDSPI